MLRRKVTRIELKPEDKEEVKTNHIALMSNLMPLRYFIVLCLSIWKFDMAHVEPWHLM